MTRQRPRIPRPIDLDQLLYGTTTWEQVADFFKRGEFHEEHYLVDAIKKHLLTPFQLQRLRSLELSIEDVLNGRFHGTSEAVARIMEEWNAKLGFRSFHF
jgi:hypothetical protein